MELAVATPWQMWAVFLIIGAVVAAYVSERFALELVSAGALVALLFLFHFAPLEDIGGGLLLTTDDLLDGFSSAALISIMGLLIIGQGMFQSGALEHPTQGLLTLHERYPRLTVATVFVFVMAVSAFLNNTPVVVMFIPIVAALAQKSKTPVSRLMIPLSFLSIFGGMTTVIGSSTNMLAVEAYRQTKSGVDIGFFELTPLGLFIALIGVVYLSTVGRRLLPDRAGPGDDPSPAEREGKQFIAQIEVTRDHPLLGEGPVAGLFPQLPDITVRMVQRRDKPILPPFDDLKFRTGDILILAATRQALTALLKANPKILDGLMAETEIQISEDRTQRAQLTLVEAVVAPGSRLVGQTIAQTGFNYRTNCVILGIERRSRMIRARMNSIRLEAGDVLLILGDINNIRSLRAERDILLLERSMEGLPDRRNARVAGGIFALVVAAASTGVAPVAVVALTGAALMVAAGCLNVRQAARAIDRRIVLLIAASLALGAALQATGGARLIGETLAAVAAPFGPTALISCFFILCAALTNVLSNNATVVLFTPIAVNAAQLAGVDPHVLVLTIIFAANCSFATPVAYQTNLLVMAPGHYRFRDFIVVGGPLIILVWLLYTAVAPVYFRMIGAL
ncbi:MAG: SLC13 family permease [Pseudomonadota bacterium]